MRDERGLYYHAQAGNPRVRVYVREGANGVEFRLWEREHPEIWEKHEWLPYEVIERAASLYKAERNPDANPLKLYDIAIAKALVAGDRD